MPHGLTLVTVSVRRDCQTEAVFEVVAPSESELRQAHCWFPTTDRVAGRPDITAFKQRARLHQAEWRESRGFPMGTHPGRNGEPDDNGSKMAPAGPRDNDFRNFLDSDAVRKAVEHRSSVAVKKSEPGQQFKEDRLRYDLLSSMPMCFNLFGELHGDRSRLTAAGEELFGTKAPGVTVKFEHSPRRQSNEFSNDGTAFDVALYFDEPDGDQSIVGIETKYHEHAVAEPKPDAPKKDKRTGDVRAIPPVKLKMPHYRALSEAAVAKGIFKPGWEDLLGTELQQIWRDHLLLLSMLFHPGGRWSSGRYVLVHPGANRAFAEAAETYRTTFLEDSITFDVVTIEDLLKKGLLHTAESQKEFESRYLW